jgi:hypothetical protein
MKFALRTGQFMMAGAVLVIAVEIVYLMLAEVNKGSWYTGAVGAYAILSNAVTMLLVMFTAPILLYLRLRDREAFGRLLKTSALAIATIAFLFCVGNALVSYLLAR